jgi:hypothetical protein
MASDTAIQTAIYKMGLDAGQYKTEAERVAAANQKIVSSTDGVVVSEEKVTKATRLTAEVLDRKIARLDPLFAAQQRYARALEMVQRYELEGVGTAEQRARLIDLETQKYQQQVVAIERLNTVARQVVPVDPVFGRLGQNATSNERLIAGMAAAGAATATLRGGIKLTSFEMQNLTYQINDVVMGLATGQRPMTVAMQQGAQVAQIFGTRLKEIPAAIGAALLTPLGQVVTVVGLVTAGVAAMFLAERSHAKQAEDALAKHAELIGEIKRAYGGAQEAAEQYATVSVRVLRALDQEQKRIIQDQLNQQAADISNKRGRYGALSAAAGEISPATYAALKELRLEAARGEADWRRFGNAIVDAISDPAISDNQKKIALGLLDIARAAEQTQSSISGISTSLAAVFASQQAQLGRYMGALQQLRSIAPPELTDRQQAQNAYKLASGTGQAANREERDDAYFAYQAALQRIDANEKLAASEKAVHTAVRASAGAVRASTQELDRHQQAIDELNADLDFQIAEFGKSAEQIRIDTELRRLNVDATSEQGRAIAAKMHLIDQENEKLDKLADRMEFEKELTRGVIDDVKGALRSGEDVWTAFGTAATNALDKITDKLLDEVLDAIFQVNTAGAGGGIGGGIGGGFLGFIGRLFGGGAAGAAAGQGGIGAMSPQGPNVVPFPTSRSAAGGVPQVSINHQNMGTPQEVVSATPSRNSSGGIDLTIITRDLKKQMAQEFGLTRASNNFSKAS